MSIKVGMRPVHPGEVLREDFLRPAGLSVNALAKALHVPTPRINDGVRERRGITADDHTIAITPRKPVRQRSRAGDLRG